MAAVLRVASLQTCSGLHVADNIAMAEPMVRQAADRGASLIVTPEMVAGLVRGRSRALETALPEEGHPFLEAACGWARELGVTILLGSMAIAIGSERLANRSFLIGPDGIVARYDKIHMFDVTLPDGEVFRESDTYRPGDRAVVAPTPWAPIGLTICYDIRFPYLYRGLSKAGARIITVPSAFTRPTGAAHWHVLNRARAIETGCFILAPAQTGDHEGGRQTYGHSLVIDPWGEVLADMGPEPGLCLSDLDLGAVDRAREMIPSLSHERLYHPAGARGDA